MEHDIACGDVSPNEKSHVKFCSSIKRVHLVGCKFLYTIKYMRDEIIVRYKACFIASGYSQRYGID